MARSEANLKVISDFVAANDWISFLAKDPATRSNTSVCLTLKLEEAKVKQVVKLLEAEGVAYLLCAAQVGWFSRKVGAFSLLSALLYPLPLVFFFLVFFWSAARSGSPW